MEGGRDSGARVGALLAVFVAAAAVAAFVIRPWIAAPLTFDTAAAVLHFDRIAGGHHLEQALSTTPKPLLTLIYGLLYSATHDWRVISVAALGAWGLCVTAGAALAWRLGGLVAATFVAVGLVLSSRLLLETAWALGSVWALLLWLVAGLAVTTPRPHWGLAGAALGIAALARLETFLVIGLALVVLVVIRLGPARWRRRGPGQAWRLSIGLLALPIMGLHDLLLVGDPFFWISVAAKYSAAAASAGRLPSLWAVVSDIVGLLRGEALIALLAVVGMGVLAARGRWAMAIGLAALGPGTAAFLLFLAARHVFVDERYFVPIDVAMLLAAGIGLTAIRVPGLGALLVGRLRTLADRFARARPAPRALATVLVVAGVAALGSPALGPLNPQARQTISAARHLAASADAALPALRSALANPTGGGPASTIVVYVPVPIRPRIAVDLDLSLGRVASYRDIVAWAAGGPEAGQMILVDVDPFAPSTGSTEFQLSAPATVRGVPLVPRVADRGRGFWLLQVAGP